MGLVIGPTDTRSLRRHNVGPEMFDMIFNVFRFSALPPGTPHPFELDSLGDGLWQSVDEVVALSTRAWVVGSEIFNTDWPWEPSFKLCIAFSSFKTSNDPEEPRSVSGGVNVSELLFELAFARHTVEVAESPNSVAHGPAALPEVACTVSTLVVVDVDGADVLVGIRFFGSHIGAPFCKAGSGPVSAHCHSGNTFYSGPCPIAGYMFPCFGVFSDIGTSPVSWGFLTMHFAPVYNSLF